MIRSCRGRAGTHIPGIWFGGPYLSFGARIRDRLLRQASVGVGVIGDSIGITATQCSTTTGTSPAATPSTTAMLFYRGGGERGVASERGARSGARSRPFEAGARSAESTLRGCVITVPAPLAMPFGGRSEAARGYGEPRGESGCRSGAFSGYDHGGQVRSFSSRGSVQLRRRSFWRRGAMAAAGATLAGSLWFPGRLESGKWREVPMRRTKRTSTSFAGLNVPQWAAIALLLTVCLPLVLHGSAAGSEDIFIARKQASNALVTAVQSNDEKAHARFARTGRESRLSPREMKPRIAHSRANFVQKYREMHRLVNEPDGTTTLYIGAKNWPTPIPLVPKAIALGISIPRQARRKFCTGELAGTNYRRFAFARNSWRRKKNIRRTSTKSMPGKNLQRYRAARRSLLEGGGGRPAKPHRAAGGIGRRRGLCPRERRAADSLPRLLLPYSDRPGERRPRRREELYRERQDDRGIRVRGLSGAIPLFRRDDFHRRQRWSGV